VDEIDKKNVKEMALKTPIYKKMSSDATEYDNTAVSCNITAPPFQDAREMRSKRKWYTGENRCLFISSILVAILLLAAVIVGLTFYFSWWYDISKEVKRFHTTHATGRVDELIEVDGNHDVTVIHAKGGAVVVLDYYRSLIGIYHPEAKSCFLIGGLSAAILDPAASSDLLQSNRTKGMPVSQTLHYKLENDDYVVHDTSIVPAPIRSMCSGLKVLWLQSTNGALEGSAGSRQKRSADSVSCRIPCCIYVPSMDLTICAE